MGAPAAAAYPKVHYEFGGPIGTGVIVLTLPFVVLGLHFICGQHYCLQGLRFDTIGQAIVNLPANVGDLFVPAAFKICIQWFMIQVVLDGLLPGKTVEGVALKDGSRLKYKLSGHAAFWVTLIMTGLGSMQSESTGSARWQLSVLYDMYEELAVAAATLSFALSVGLYLASMRTGAKLADAGGAIGRNVVYDFFMGRELNPRIGPLDLKCFCELRPGLIGWAILNLGMMCKQKEILGYVSGPMMLVNLFQGLYVWDALFFERAILTTMDITTDGLGFMLVFGDLCWVPFVYSLQARYLVNNDPGLGPWSIGVLCCMNVLGYVIFRGANGQKDAFRTDPSAPAVAHLKWMPTKRGTKLLTSGWWGAARKINYTGDWIMSLSWCMLTGFNSLVPYFYCIYFGILLVHRAFRDDHACAAKYGADWKTYKSKVPDLFIPGVF